MWRSRSAESPYDGCQHDSRLCGSPVVALVTDQLAEGRAAFSSPTGRSSEAGREAALAVERLAHVGEVLVEVLGELVGSRGTTQ